MKRKKVSKVIVNSYSEYLTKYKMWKKKGYIHQRRLTFREYKEDYALAKKEQKKGFYNKRKSYADVLLDAQKISKETRNNILKAIKKGMSDKYGFQIEHGEFINQEGDTEIVLHDISKRKYKKAISYLRRMTEADIFAMRINLGEGRSDVEEDFGY